MMMMMIYNIRYKKFISFPTTQVYCILLPTWGLTFMKLKKQENIVGAYNIYYITLLEYIFSFNFVFYYDFTSCDFSTPVLAGSLSLQSERQQVSSGLQDSSQYCLTSTML